MPPIKKLAAWLLTILLGFAILTEPNKAAENTGPILDFAITGIKNVFVFFGAVLSYIA